MTSLVEMTSFRLYPLGRSCKHSRCHVRKFLKAIAKESGSAACDPLSRDGLPRPNRSLCPFPTFTIMTSTEITRWNAELRVKSPLDVVRWAISQARSEEHTSELQ